MVPSPVVGALHTSVWKAAMVRWLGLCDLFCALVCVSVHKLLTAVTKSGLPCSFVNVWTVSLCCLQYLPQTGSEPPCEGLEHHLFSGS